MLTLSPAELSRRNAVKVKACGTNWRRAVRLLWEECCPLDSYSVRSAMQVCARAGKWEEALKLLDDVMALDDRRRHGEDASQR